MTPTQTNPVQQFLPHRPPMLLVDQVIERNETSIVCEKTFSGDEFFFQGHYPDQPICPGVILCECGVQAGAVFIAHKFDITAEGVPVLTKLESVRFKRIVRPGETIRMHVTLDDTVSSAFYMSAKVTCGGQIAARFSFVCTLANAPA